MDQAQLQEKISAVLEQLKKDPALRQDFQQEPVKTLEKVLGVDLPDEAIEKILAAVKANLSAKDVGQLFNAAHKLFSK